RAIRSFPLRRYLLRFARHQGGAWHREAILRTGRRGLRLVPTARATVRATTRPAQVRKQLGRARRGLARTRAPGRRGKKQSSFLSYFREGETADGVEPCEVAVTAPSSRVSFRVAPSGAAA